ncbi:MAG: hypothetical protein V7784_12295 [Oceanospirillaceae bacterium]
MNDFTLDELKTLADVFNRAAINSSELLADDLQKRIASALEQREELESLDFEDCLSCKL